MQRQLSPKTSLKTIILNEISYYLRIDNPEPDDLAAAKDTAEFFSMIMKNLGIYASTSGKEGRERAKRYQNDITNFAESGNKSLIKKVFNDLTIDEGVLGSSMANRLRTRLWSALCEYYSITDEEITIEEETYRRKMVNAYTGNSFPPPIQLRMTAMKNLVKPFVDNLNQQSISNRFSTSDEGL